MVLRRESITERLKELDLVVKELSQYKSSTVEDLRADLSRRWIIERGLIAAASLILDIADHILVEQFSQHSNTYEESLVGLADKSIINQQLYQELKGLGGFRNLLVHLYQEVDLQQLWANFQKAISVFPQYSMQILTWLDEQT